jgi:protein lysine acetyltransferase
MSIDVATLQELDLFHDCSASDLTDVLAVLAPAQVDAGAVLMREGEHADGFVLIVEGSAVVHHDDNGEQRLIGSAGAGSIVGELALLRGGPRTATVTADAPLVGLVGDLSGFGHLLDAPGVGARVTRIATQRLVAEVHPVPITLDDGTRLQVRPMLPTDRHKLSDALHHLSREAQRQRFFTTAPLTDRMISYLVDLDYRDHFAWIVLPGDDPDGALVASARSIRSTDDGRLAEVAFGTTAGYEGRGIASFLLGALAVSAVDRSIERFLANVLAENRSMRAVLDKVGAQWERAEPGVVSTVVDVAPCVALVGDAATGAALRRSCRQIGRAAALALT